MNVQTHAQHYFRYSAVIWPVAIIMLGVVLHVEASWLLLIAVLPAAVWGYASLWGLNPWGLNRSLTIDRPADVPPDGGPRVEEEVLGAIHNLDKSVAELAAASKQAVFHLGTVLPDEQARGLVLPRVTSNARREVASVLQYIEALDESAQVIQTTLEQASTNIQNCREEHAAMHTSVSEATECLRILTEALVGAEEVVTEMNFLALNASIEAAKASAEGQSFTIIANNIRSLHDQIQILVNNLRGGLNRLRSALGLTVQHAGIETQKTTSSLNGIQFAIRQSTDNLGRLAAFAEARQRLISAVDEQILESESVRRVAEVSRAQTSQIQAALGAVCAAIPGIETHFADVVKKLEGRPSE